MQFVSFGTIVIDPIRAMILNPTNQLRRDSFGNLSTCATRAII